MSALQQGLGFYGKFPSLGDFVSRRLPRSFIDPWDEWLQSGLLDSQQQLGEKWLSTFLVSPIWRFAISPGLCGDSAWAGIMMPSVDRVGRYFPLTLVKSIAVNEMSVLFQAENDWFDQLEKLALSVLNQDFDFEQFDQSAQQVQMRLNSDANMILSHNARLSVQHYNLENAQQWTSVFPRLSQDLLVQLYPSYSWWAVNESGFNYSQFLCCDKLPPAEVYTRFLTGETQQNITPYPIEIIQQPPSTNSPDETGLQQLFQSHSEDFIQTKSPVRWISVSLSVAGNKRELNEDAFLNKPEAGLWVVADGMGGHQSGDVASKLIVDTLAEIPILPDLITQHKQVCNALQQINQNLLTYAENLQKKAIVGSTVVILLAKEYACQAVWAGDSRLYRLRQGSLVQLTRDHTLVDQLMQTNGLSRQQALLHAGANVITRAVGGHSSLELESLDFIAEPGDKYLLCTDGLDKELSDTEITQYMMTGNSQAIADTLIKQALEKNGSDNITVIVLEVQ